MSSNQASRRSSELLQACGYDLELSLVPYEVDPRQDARLEKRLLSSPQERLQAMLKSPRRSLMARSDPFDPIAILQALDERRVRYVVVGALGRVILGSDEITDGIDIVPSPREENLRRLGLALDHLQARRTDEKPLAIDTDLARDPVVDLATAAGELKVVLEPAGTQRLRRPPPQRYSRAARPRRPAGRRLARRPRPHARRSRSRTRSGGSPHCPPPNRARARSPPKPQPRPHHRALTTCRLLTLFRTGSSSLMVSETQMHHGADPSCCSCTVYACRAAVSGAGPLGRNVMSGSRLPRQPSTTGSA